MSTPYHAAFWARALTCKGPSDAVESLTRSMAWARVDLNPHQVDAAFFAVRSPLLKGVILADEVGLGKTIEAGLIIAPSHPLPHRCSPVRSLHPRSVCLPQRGEAAGDRHYLLIPHDDIVASASFGAIVSRFRFQVAE